MQFPFYMIYRIGQADSKIYSDKRRARKSQDVYEKEEQGEICCTSFSIVITELNGFKHLHFVAMMVVALK